MNNLSLYDLTFQNLPLIEDNSNIYQLQNVPPNSPYSGFYLTLSAKQVIVFETIELEINILSQEKDVEYLIDIVAYPYTESTIDFTSRLCRSNETTLVQIPIIGNGYGAILVSYYEATSNAVVYQNIKQGFKFL